MVNKNLDAHEEFLGLRSMESTNANSQGYSKNINENKLERNGVTTWINSEETRAQLTHCIEPSLNLALEDAKNALRITHETTSMIKKSPKRTVKLALKKSIKLESCIDDNHKSKVIKLLCPSKWTVQA